MATSSQRNTAVTPRSATGREALLEAAKRLLPERAPSAIAGRDLAAEAGVNYGLVHHYFGGKDAALRSGLTALREDFVAAHGHVATMPLLTTSDPYLKALVRWYLHDVDGADVDGEFPLAASLVAAVASRLDGGDAAPSAEAKARAIALTSLQLCVAVFGPVLLEATGVDAQERRSVERALAALYDSIALRDGGQSDEPPMAD
jgi:AcrR family transcriptional regulator